MLNLSVSKYTCQYCKSSFTQEKTLTVHMCETKRRYYAKNDRATVAGFQTYNRFYQLTQNSKENKTFDEFARSQYYNAFVKFGSFVSNVNPLYPDKFIDYVVKSGVKLDHWCREELYEKYVVNLIHTESVETALERSVTHMESWAKDNNSLWNHYFRYVSSNRASYDIKDGKVSPWLILNSPTGKELLSSLRDDQLSSISNIIDPTVWVKKFKAQTFDLDLVKRIVQEADL
jgi:hypothetical protein